MSVLLQPAPSFPRRSSLWEGLAAFWPLQEVSGTRFDVSGRRNNLTSNNNVGSAPGIIGNAASLVAASSEYLSVSPNGALQARYGQSCTVAGWVYLNSVPAGTSGRLICQWNDTVSYVVDVVQATSEARIVVYDGTTEVIVNADHFGALSLHTWYFVCAWFDSVAQTVNVSVNNGGVNSAACVHGAQTATTPVRLGASADGFYLDGRLALWGVWQNRVLSASERSFLFNGGNGRMLR